MHFSFCPTKRIYGGGSIKALLRELARAKRIAIVVSGSAAAKTAVLDELADIADRIVLQRIFSNLGEPSYDSAGQLASDLEQAQATHVVAIGGASIVDLAKAAAIMVQFGGDADTRWSRLLSSPFDVAGLPLYVINTVPGASSEANGGFVLSDALGFKRPLARLNSFPVAMAFDPRYAATLSPTQIHTGLFDALMHVLEQCIRPEPVCPINDGLCVAAIAAILDLHRSLCDSVFGAEELMRFSRISSFALDSATLGRGVEVDGVTHELGVFLSAHYRMAHGATLAAVLPRYLDLPSSAGKRQRLAHLTALAVASVNAFHGREVLPAFDLRRHIAGAGIAQGPWRQKTDIELGAAMDAFIDERGSFWAQKKVDKDEIRAVLGCVVAELDA
jgi:alcohol dehydrogenase YqhD (iron-dependent ADH family)